MVELDGLHLTYMPDKCFEVGGYLNIFGDEIIRFLLVHLSSETIGCLFTSQDHLPGYFSCLSSLQGILFYERTPDQKHIRDISPTKLKLEVRSQEHRSDLIRNCRLLTLISAK